MRYTETVDPDPTACAPVVGRFAPSPTGRMHAGNIYAALIAWLVAKSQGGNIVLRIEDLDRQRSKRCYIDQVQRDFQLLGLTWDEGPYYQSDRNEAYESAFKTLGLTNGLYPCFCTRADLHAASAPHQGETFVYPGTCRMLSAAERAEKARKKDPAVRIKVLHERFGVVDELQGEYSEVLDTDCGDFVIRRADSSFAYQLAVVVDDAAQGVNSVVRGLDLLPSTPQQLFLQRELGYATPRYCHIPLLVAPDGRRLSKRDRDASLEVLLQRFSHVEGIIGHVAWLARLIDFDEPLSTVELLSEFSLARLHERLAGVEAIVWS